MAEGLTEANASKKISVLKREGWLARNQSGSVVGPALTSSGTSKANADYNIKLKKALLRTAIKVSISPKLCRAAFRVGVNSKGEDTFKRAVALTVNAASPILRRAVFPSINNLENYHK